MTQAQGPPAGSRPQTACPALHTRRTRESGSGGGKVTVLTDVAGAVAVAAEGSLGCVWLEGGARGLPSAQDRSPRAPGAGLQPLFSSGPRAQRGGIVLVQTLQSGFSRCRAASRVGLAGPQGLSSLSCVSGVSSQGLFLRCQHLIKAVRSPVGELLTSRVPSHRPRRARGGDAFRGEVGPAQSEQQPCPQQWQVGAQGVRVPHP